MMSRRGGPEAGAVRLDRLGKSYGAVRVVDDVSLEIAPGEIVALLGPSGCGKTTTLRMIAGLVTADSGSIFIGGQAVDARPVEQRDVGLLFQSYALFPHMTVLGNVMFGLRTWRRRTPKAQATEAARDALRQVRLEGFEERYPAALSGGQQQRVALARALVTKPRVLLLDEPLSALDKNLRTAMQAEIRALVTRLGLTTVLVTHDQEEAMTVADRIAVMNNGRMIQVGSAADLYERPGTRFVADFVGTANFFDGTVDGRDPARPVLVTRSGLRLGLPQAKLAGGEPVTVVVRPERIRLALAGAPSANTAEGTVEMVGYRGNTVSFSLRLDDGQLLHCAVLNAGRPVDVAVGARAGVTWDDDANVIVAQDEPSGRARQGEDLR